LSLSISGRLAVRASALIAASMLQRLHLLEFRLLTVTQRDSIAIHYLLIANKLEADMTPKICRYRDLIET
jgi:hypothetical protein